MGPYKFSFRNLSVTWKFVIAYSCILAVSLAGSGVYLYTQLANSAVEQAQQVMEHNLIQTRDSVLEKVGLIENVSQLIASDIKLQSFLGTTFTGESYQYEEYRSEISPFVENVLRQNPYIASLRIYMFNASIPELYDSFYRIDRLEGLPEYAGLFRPTRPTTGWRGLHPQLVHLNVPLRGGDIPNVFSYYEIIQSFRYSGEVGVLEIDVKEDVMFDMLDGQGSVQLGSVFVADGQGNVVTGGDPAGAGRNVADLGIGELPSGAFNEVRTIGGERSIVIGVPIDRIGLRIVGLFPVSAFTEAVQQSARQIAIVLFFALLVLGAFVYFITSALLSRLKLLLRAMKQVKEGSLTANVPAFGNDEFSQIASSFNLMTGRIHELVETVYKIQLMEREAELRALESQVNPHFLYNSLATISWVARKAQSKEIVDISNALAKFYRLMLNKGRREILIKDEVAMVKAYLEIQKFRYEDVFDVIYEIDESVYAYTAAKNLLQPVVENALVHGIEPKRDHGTLIIKAGVAGDMLYYQVIDDGVGMRKDRLQDIREGRSIRSGGSGSGYAVKNIMERLQAYYGDKYRFELHSGPGIGTAVTIMFGKEKRG
ncbi:sensor histidine kinase [Paenibacillus sp.]|uniref:cache domain-containing sensor histidine kinase n=1 Tax=Paenibacillus sp. TaxID=58172 RepID=UPI002811D089|nr:sensor histidine kinase [Paenibacillus sp.]